MSTSSEFQGVAFPGLISEYTHVEPVQGDTL
jgi:hypothetical protein